MVMQQVVFAVFATWKFPSPTKKKLAAPLK
jgi:hypothetical protein